MSGGGLHWAGALPRLHPRDSGVCFPQIPAQGKQNNQCYNLKELLIWLSSRTCWFFMTLSAPWLTAWVITSTSPTTSTCWCRHSSRSGMCSRYNLVTSWNLRKWMIKDIFVKSNAWIGLILFLNWSKTIPGFWRTKGLLIIFVLFPGRWQGLVPSAGVSLLCGHCAAGGIPPLLRASLQALRQPRGADTQPGQK